MLVDTLERPSPSVPDGARPTLAALPPRAVLIHGGQYKSGTSAVQNALAAGAAQLAAQGWRYPQAGRIHDPTLGHRHLRLMQEVRHGSVQGQWARLRHEIDRSDDRVVLSHEGFFSPELDPALIAHELPGREVHVLVYLRHPVDHVESGWREWARRWRFTGTPRDWFNQRRDWLDITRVRQRWEAVFGAGHVHLRAFARECFPQGNVVVDLAQLLGLPDGLPRLPMANGSLNTRQALVMWVANRLRSDPAQCEALLDLVADAGAAQAALAQLDAMAQAAGFEAAHKAALARVLQGIDERARMVADALAHDIESQFLALHVHELAAQGQVMDAGGGWRGQWRDQPFDAGMNDGALLRAVATLLGH